MAASLCCLFPRIIRAEAGGLHSATQQGFCMPQSTRQTNLLIQRPTQPEAHPRCIPTSLPFSSFSFSSHLALLDVYVHTFLCQVLALCFLQLPWTLLVGVVFSNLWCSLYDKGVGRGSNYTHTHTQYVVWAFFLCNWPAAYQWADCSWPSGQCTAPNLQNQSW